MLTQLYRGILIVSSLIVLSVVAEAQITGLQLVPDSRHIYTDGTTQDKLHKFGYLFKADPNQSHSFTKFNEIRIAQKCINYVSGAFVVGGIINRLRNPDAGLSYINVPIIAGGLGNLIFGNAKRRAKEELLYWDVYNPLGLDNVEYGTVDRYKLKGFSQVSKHKFLYNSQKGALHDFWFLFEFNQEVQETFDLFDFYRKKQLGWNAIAGSIFGAGVVTGFFIDFSNPVISAIYGIYGIGSGVLIGLINNLSVGIKKARYKDRLLTLIDTSVAHHSPKASSLNVAFTQNGVGLVYQF